MSKRDHSRRSLLEMAGGLALAGLFADAVHAVQEGDAGAAPSDEITVETIAEAEKLVGVRFTPVEREMMVAGLRQAASGYERRRRIALTNVDAPGQIFDPRLPGRYVAPADGPLRLASAEAPALPRSDEDIAFAPVTSLSAWLHRGELTSVRLTRLYLERLKRIGPTLECVITLTEATALAQAEAADVELAAGRSRRPLHGIPYGAKDLFDTKDIATTWGATPYRDRVATEDAYVVRRLREAGAVLVAKLTLGALAYGDIWFGGVTKNPWDLNQGSSGSSAGSAAATAAGLVGFALGTETYGSIVSPCMRCGTTGLRPTFGRVARTGAMALCWSLDKIGPITRTVEDAALVFDAVRGADDGDPSSRNAGFPYDGAASVRGVRLGYDPAWFEQRGAHELDRCVLERLGGRGIELVPVEMPDADYGAMMPILGVEAAAAFEELTLTDADDSMVWQDPAAWPNSFREARFVPAIEYVQAERFRRRVMGMMADVMTDVDALISPSFAAGLLLVTNFTGHPCLTLRCGVRSNGRPRNITLWGRLDDEATLCRVGREVEASLDVWRERPTLRALGDGDDG
ncbi:MAG: amidase [Phycisphaerales bacterium]|nr:amidase [Phycisphaerales bacterium]